MSFDSKRAKEITATPSNEVPACCVADCPNGADPRYSILVNGVFAAACDGHESYSADRHRLRDPLPRWPIHESIREREALALLPSALDEIDRLHQLLRDEFAIGAEYQKQAAIAQAEVERLRAGDPQATPFPLTPQAARQWLQAKAEAYQHVLERMGPTEARGEALMRVNVIHKDVSEDFSVTVGLFDGTECAQPLFTYACSSRDSSRDEIDRLHQLLRDEFAIGAEYQKQAAIAQAEAERLRAQVEEANIGREFAHRHHDEARQQLAELQRRYNLLEQLVVSDAAARDRLRDQVLEAERQLAAVTKARDQACRIAKDWIGMRAHSLDEPARLAIKEVAELSKAGQ